MKKILLALLLLWFQPACAYQTVELELTTGTSMNLNQFRGEGETLFLWLPSQRGFGQGYIPVALNLSAMDYDVWAADLHDTYIIPTGRNSLNEVELDDLIALINAARDQGFKEIYLIGSSRAAELALKMAYLWQQQNPDSSLLKGLLSFSPHLIKGRTEMGSDADYVEIAAYSNLPVYMLQAQYSPKFARSREISQQLRQGGSQVFIHVFREVQGGFHMRPVEDLTEKDLAMRQQLPQVFETAINLIRQVKTSPLINGFQLLEDGDEIKQGKIKVPALHPYQGNKSPPPLTLNDLKGQVFDLAQSKGQVVLVNFWATWCGPCVEEVPSLSRLVERMKQKPFKVVAVNIGESEADIGHFIKSFPVNFDILLDRDGQAVRDWKVYAYPSNFLLDKNGQIQFAYRGALEWDAPEIVKTIEQLL